MSFSLTYTVTAATEYEAIAAAVALLRTNVRLRGVNSVQRATPTLWRVSLNVWEDA
jgi:hypothetical protein